MGKLNSSKRYLYIATGAGLSPNINRLRFYDSGTTYYTNKVFYDETNTYAMWISPVGYWFIGLISANRDTPGNCFAKSVNNSGEPPTGNYIGSNGFSGTVTISSHISDKISINRRNLGGGKLNLKKKYLYKATGTSLSPDINGLRFYDSGLTSEGLPIYYAEDLSYKLQRNNVFSNFYVWNIYKFNYPTDQTNRWYTNLIQNPLTPDLQYPNAVNGAMGTVTISSI